VTAGRGRWERCAGSYLPAVDLQYDPAPGGWVAVGGKCPHCKRPVLLGRERTAWPHRELSLAERPLPDGLAGTSFETAGCRQAEGEPLLAARARGRAAECAGEALELLQDGDVAAAREVLKSALLYADQHGEQL
jgi:hypothetical protein